MWVEREVAEGTDSESSDGAQLVEMAMELPYDRAFYDRLQQIDGSEDGSLFCARVDTGHLRCRQWASG